MIAPAPRKPMPVTIWAATRDVSVPASGSPAGGAIVDLALEPDGCAEHRRDEQAEREVELQPQVEWHRGGTSSRSVSRTQASLAMRPCDYPPATTSRSSRPEIVWLPKLE
jgi:hypothetical protein